MHEKIGVLVIYCCIINHPKLQQLEIANIYYLTVLKWVRNLGTAQPAILAQGPLLQSSCQPELMAQLGRICLYSCWCGCRQGFRSCHVGLSMGQPGDVAAGFWREQERASEGNLSLFITESLQCHTIISAIFQSLETSQCSRPHSRGGDHTKVWNPEWEMIGYFTGYQLQEATTAVVTCTNCLC